MIYDEEEDRAYIRSRVTRLIQLLLIFRENEGIVLEEELVPWMEWFDDTIEPLARSMTEHGICVLPVEDNE